MKIERDLLLEKFRSFNLENKQLMKPILEKDAVMNTMAACFVDLMRKVAAMDTVKGIQAKPSADLLSSTTRRVLRVSARMTV